MSMVSRLCNCRDRFCNYSSSPCKLLCMHASNGPPLTGWHDVTPSTLPTDTMLFTYLYIYYIYIFNYFIVCIYLLYVFIYLLFHQYDCQGHMCNRARKEN